jgi:hypothetical protein
MNGLVIDYMHFTSAKGSYLGVKIAEETGQNGDKGGVVLGPKFRNGIELMQNTLWQQRDRIWKNERCGL